VAVGDPVETLAHLVHFVAFRVVLHAEPVEAVKS
jgi:hypothetical protein